MTERLITVTQHLERARDALELPQPSIPILEARSQIEAALQAIQLARAEAIGALDKL